MNKAAVLLSGGIDSVTLLHYVRKRQMVRDVHALSFDYGQKHSRELEMARWQAADVGVTDYRIIDITVVGDLVMGNSALTDDACAVPDLASLDKVQRRQPSTYVPNRNAILLALTAAYAETNGIGDIFYGAQAQDEYGYWDCTVEFVARLNGLLQLNRGVPVTVHAPFIGMRKVEILKIGLELGVDYSHTWSCYRGGVAPCGTCPTCVERACAFNEVGVRDELSNIEE